MRFILLHPVRLSRCLMFTVLLVTIACNSTTPTSAPTRLPEAGTSASATARSTPSDTQTPNPSDTLTTTATVSPTADSTSTNTPESSIVQPPVGLPGPTGIGKNVWFMSQLITYFSRLGAYPPEPPPSRPPNVNPLTGLEVSNPALLLRRPILARIGNDPGARPQAGLNQADLVFEELIDQHNGLFALTRFTAVYLGQDGTVRPFRSARPVNASLQPMFDGALAHSGASNGTRFLLGKMPWGTPLTRSLNMDDLWFGSAYCTIGSYWVTRMTSTVARIHAVLASKGLDSPVALTGFEFSPTPTPGSPANAVSFDHNPWPVSRVGVTQWKYDAVSGHYLRFAGGVPHNSLQYPISGNWGGSCGISGPQTAAQVSAANVVVLSAEYEPTDIVEDVNNFYSAFIQLVGSGTVKIYRDGVQITGTWVRPSLQHFFQFKDANGGIIPLKPGNTWFEIAPLNYVPTVK